MINLFNRTEFSFKIAYGPLAKVLDKTPVISGICDRHGTWGHVQFEKACKKRGIKPVFGVELALVDDPLKKEKQGVRFIRLVAKNNNGLKQIYETTTRASHEEQFYYFPRIGMKQLEELSNDVVIVTSKPVDFMNLKANLFLELNPNTTPTAITWALAHGIPPIAASDNLFPGVNDQEIYQITVNDLARDDKTTPMFILSEDEWLFHAPGDLAFKNLALLNAKNLGEFVDVKLPKAEIVHPERKNTLFEMCLEGAAELKIEWTEEYSERLDREIGLIAEKNFEDYFYLISDLVKHAKKTMLVGPARGSSSGSLVCYLLGITDVDPIPYGLLFERFIDINRKDLPDIDIDFPDLKRDQILSYLKDKYGHDCVAQLGTVNRFKAVSAIGDIAKAFGIPQWEVKEMKENVIEREDGDARAFKCVQDTFQIDVGKRLLQKYPHMVIAGEVEGHAKHTSKHAAGIVVTSNPVSYYCSVDNQTGSAQVDKIDAEELNLLKIDALGLRTLSVIEDCLDQIGWDREKLLKHPMDDEKVFAILNDEKFSGIFQFEGYALQSLCRQMKVENFEDMVSLTSLARPGPLQSGLAYDWLGRRTGREKIVYEHEDLKRILKNTYGVMVYQENIMHIIREIAGMSWEDVSAIRKAISKSAGQEVFDKYKDGYLKGCAENNFGHDVALKYWNNMIQFGSYAFNRSHAVAYAMVSYWCMVLKTYYPLEYAAACLRNSKDEEQEVAILRELKDEGYKFKSFDKEKSRENWSVQDGVLIGGLLGVKGIAEKTAADIIRRRREGVALTKRQSELLDNPTTPYDMVFECRERFGYIFDNPQEHGIESALTMLKDITENSDGIFCFIAKIKEMKQKNANDPEKVKDRGGREIHGNPYYLNLKVEDDTDSIGCTINRDEFEKYGKPILENGKVGDWYIFKGRCSKGFRWCHIARWKKL